MISDKVALVEEPRRSPYPGRVAFRIGITLLFIGFGGIGCAIGSRFVGFNILQTENALLCISLVIGGSALLTGIFAVISGKSTSGRCLACSVLIFAIISFPLAGWYSYQLIVLFQDLKKIDPYASTLSKLSEMIVPNNPISQELNVVWALCIVLIILGCLDTLLTLIMSFVACRGICFCRQPAYSPYRAVFVPPQTPPVLITH